MLRRPAIQRHVRTVALGISWGVLIGACVALIDSGPMAERKFFFAVALFGGLALLVSIVDKRV